MRTIAVVNAKGGSGKTTIATNLAAALAWEGHIVALGDMDPLQSASDWLALRPKDYPEVLATSTRSGRLRAPPETDILVLDTPAGLGSPELGNIVRRAQTLIVPVLPDGPDLRQQVVVVVQPRQGGELIVRLESFGDPIITETVRGAVHAVTEWVLEQPGLTLRSRFY